MEVLVSMIAGIVVFFIALAFALRLVLEKLTQKNIEYIREWETLLHEPKVTQIIDKSKRKAKGLAHKRRNRGEDAFVDSTLKECTCNAVIDGRNVPCIAQLKIGQLILFQQASADSSGAGGDDKGVAVLETLMVLSLRKIVKIEPSGVNSLVVETLGEDDRRRAVEISFPSESHRQDWLTSISPMLNAAVSGKEEEKKSAEEPLNSVVPEASLDELESDTFTTRKVHVPFEEIKTSSAETSSPEFLNRLLWRHFQEMASWHVFEERIGERIVLQIKKKIAKSKAAGLWPWFLQPIQFNHIIKGNGFITVHSLKLDKVLGDGTLLGLVDASYSGGAGVSLSTALLLKAFGTTFGHCNVELVIRLMRIRAHLYVFMPRNFDEKSSLLFEHFPNLEDVEFDVEAYVGKRKIPLVRYSDTMRRFADSLMCRLTCISLVYPSRLRFFLPYPGRKPQAKIQRYLTPSQAAKKLVEKTKEKQKQQQQQQQQQHGEEGGEGDENAPLHMEDEEESMSTDVPLARSIRSIRKASERRKRVLELFECIADPDAAVRMSALCDEEMEVFGFSDIDGHIVGVQAFLIALTDLRRRFQGMTFTLDSESTFEEGVFVSWSIRGMQVAKVWDKYPANTQVPSGFRGSCMCYLDLSFQIVGLDFFWVL